MRLEIGRDDSISETPSENNPEHDHQPQRLSVTAQLPFLSHFQLYISQRIRNLDII
jgi:hypothetical protein